jgi:hypothetical protein
VGMAVQGVALGGGRDGGGQWGGVCLRGRRRWRLRWRNGADECECTRPLHPLAPRHPLWCREGKYSSTSVEAPGGRGKIAGRGVQPSRCLKTPLCLSRRNHRHSRCSGDGQCARHPIDPSGHHT